MRKSKKTLAILTIIAMVLMMVPVQAFADTPASNRLADADRVGTAIAIANNGWTSASTVIVAPADDANLVDALAVAPLAGQDNAPILMTYKDGLDAKVAAEIAALKATNVIAVGALSDAAVNQLKAISGVTVTAVKGTDRFETAAKVAGMLTSPAGTFVVAYNGLADALSAASFAAANNYAIMIADTNGALPASEKAVGSKTYTVGGQVTIAGATAFAGADRYATNDAVLKGLTYKYDKVYVANGETLVDALAGSALAAKTQSPIVLANTTGAAAAAGVKANLTASSQVIAFGGTAVVPDAVLGMVSGATQPTGPVSVQSVSAISANSIKVVFSAAPADTSKVAFTVKRDTTAVAVTATWNDAKTEATLSGSANFPEGNYSVAVKNDTTDLGSSTVSITAQKLAKINITSDKLGIVTNGTTQTGYATYNAQDQYGNDVTNSSLASGIQFQTGIATGTFSGDHGLLKFTVSSGLNALSFSNVVITASDANSGVSTSATLTVSTQVGTLSSFKLTTLTNADGKVLTADDSTSIFYANYEALDLSGNPTTNLDLIEGGLITNDNQTNGGLNAYGLTSSSPYVNANIVADPMDSHKAVIEVKVKTGTVLTMDMPVTLTAMTWTGASSSLNVTLKKAATADSFTLMAPSFDIAANDTNKAIPFVAYDQDGNQLTKYDDITGVNFSTNITAVKNVDGTLGLLFTPNPAVKGQQVLTAMTSTGKYSSLTINVQDNYVAQTLNIDPSVLVSSMEQSNGSVFATQSIDAGYSDGGLTVLDQYGRSVNINTATAKYQVLAKITNGNSVTLSAGNNTPGGSGITVNGMPAIIGGGDVAINSTTNLGTSTIEFDLVSTATPGTIIDSKSVQISNIATSDIKSYTIDSVANPIYTEMASTATNGTLTSYQKAYAANPGVYGKTSSGGKVVLAGTPVIGVNSSSSDFVTNFSSGTPVAADSVYLVAKKFSDASKTGSDTTLTVTLLDPTNKVHTASTAIKSTTADPAVSNLYTMFDKSFAGVSTNTAGDVVTLAAVSGGSTIGQVITSTGLDTNSGFLTRYNASGAKNAGPIYFYASNQYASKAADIAQVVVSSDKVVDSTGAAKTDGTFAVDSTGLVTTGISATGKSSGDVETITLTAVTGNGLTKTVQLVIKW